MNAIGRRYERLLLASAPLTLASAIVMFVALATTQTEQGTYGACLSEALDAMELAKPKLDQFVEKSGEKFVVKSKDEIEHGVSVSMLKYKTSHSCWNLLDADFDKFKKHPLQYSILDVRKIVQQLHAQPVQYLGIELPDKASISIFGTTITVALRTFATLLQFLLVPVLVLWIGSLLNTRNVEILNIAHAAKIEDVFPHVVNAYAASFEWSTVRRIKTKPWLARVGRELSFLFVASIRAGFVAVFVVPPTAALLVSLWVSSRPGLWFVYYMTGAIIGMFTVIVLLIEFFGPHYRKQFRVPRAKYAESPE